MKKHLALLLTLVLISTSLCGCGVVDKITELAGGKQVATVEELLEKNKEVQSEEFNGHLEVEVGYNIAVEAEGESVSMPMSLTIGMDSFGKESMHANLKYTATIFGITQNGDGEVYITAEDGQVKTYSKESSSDYWTVQDGEDSDIDFDELLDLEEINTKDVEMEYDKKSKTYQIKMGVPQEDIDLLGSEEGAMEMFSISNEVLKEMYENARLVYTFDNEFKITSIELLGYEYKGPMELEGVTANIDFGTTLSVKFSNYGNIKAEDVKVPQDVIDSAVPSVSVDGDISFNNEDNSSDNEGINWGDINLETEETQEESEKGNTDTEESEESNTNAGDNQTSVEAKDDMYGSYNGVNFTLQKDSWANTFGADGWKFDYDSDGEYSFVKAYNDKYDGADLYLYGEEFGDLYAAEIESNGIYGYSIDTDYMESSTYPNMTWNGITFGATIEDIKEVYGEYESEFESTSLGYTTYDYEIGENVEIEFKVDVDKGLIGVDARFWN